MTKATNSTPPDPSPQPASQQGQPNSSQDADNQSVSSQRMRKRDKFVNMFRSKPKATNPQSNDSKSSVQDESPASTHCLSTVGGPGSVDIDHVVSITAVKNTPSY
ncbi:hypothetical protein BGZ96_004900, partial [Linnemannia gamsii]